MRKTAIMAAALIISLVLGSWALGSTGPLQALPDSEASNPNHPNASNPSDTSAPRMCSPALSLELQSPHFPFAGVETLRLDAGQSCSGRLEAPAQKSEACLLLNDGAGELAAPDYLPGYLLPMDGDLAAALESLDLHMYTESEDAMDYVERHVRIITNKNARHFRVHLSRSTRYLKLMKQILREEGVPEEMAFLPLIESGFNNRAYSRSRAAGPWQFIKSTGKRYGLQVNPWVDERRDPVKSTRAAARYLKDLHGMFGSWSLAMAAYNAGEGRIVKALRKSKGEDFWSILPTRYIKRETRNYVPKFIAARVIAASPADYGFSGIEYQEDFVFDEVTVEYPMTFDVIAEAAGTTAAEIKELNPELLRWSTPPVESYTLRLPVGTKEKFLASLPSIPEGKRFTVKAHQVKRGETLSHIAMRTGVPANVISDYNRLGKRAFIREGQYLLIPIGYREIRR